MYYKFNKKTLTYEKVNWVKTISKFIGINLILFIFVVTNIGLSTKTPITQLTEEEVIIINRNNDVFTPEKLQEEIKRMNFRFPHIVYAQSMLETGSWTSPIFKENHNLFGMKEATIRSNVAMGTNRSHAYYRDWRESVVDYALYYATYLHDIKNEDDYFAYLDASYAEAKNYVGALKRVIEENDLKNKFNIN